MYPERSVIIYAEALRRSFGLYSCLLELRLEVFVLSFKIYVCTCKIRIDRHSAAREVTKHGQAGVCCHISFRDGSVERMSSTDSDAPIAEIGVVKEG